MTPTTTIRELQTDPALQLFLDSLTDQAVFSIDPKGFITTWTYGCQAVKGYTAEEAIGQHFRMLYTVEDRERGRPEHNLKMALEQGKYHEEHVRLRKGNVPYMAEVSIYPIEVDGKLSGFGKIVRDVSARMHLEEELVRSNRDLDGFCYSISHDIRTPIRAIVSLSKIIQEDYAEALPEEARADLDKLVENGLRLGQLVHDLLDFARLGQSALKRQDVDVSAMVRQLNEEIRPECHEGTGSIEVQNGIRAYADKSMLEIVLRNLIENGCKYSGADVRVQFGMELVNKEPVYSVQDDGIGFDMKYVSKIFEPFERLHGSEQFSGTGIGLANVKRIVERHGGRIWAESELGKGSTFFFTLK